MQGQPPVTPTGRMAGLGPAGGARALGRSRSERRSQEGDGNTRKPDEGPLPALPAPGPGLSSPSLRTPYLGSRFQGRHEVLDHLGFRDCDSAYHEEDQEGVVAGMRPAHLQNKPAPASHRRGCRAPSAYARPRGCYPHNAGEMDDP